MIVYVNRIIIGENRYKYAQKLVRFLYFRTHAFNFTFFLGSMRCVIRTRMANQHRYMIIKHSLPRPCGNNGCHKNNVIIQTVATIRPRPPKRSSKIVSPFAYK